VQGFSLGFRINSNLITPPHSDYTNHKSATSYSNIVQAKLDKERALGRIAGPFETPPFQRFVTSPLGLVPKKAPNQFRLIHDLSFPPGSSVNDHIDSSYTKVSYLDLDHCVQNIVALGPGTLIAKADLQDAFRLLPIHPDDHWLLGFKWGEAFYYDRCLPMGCSVSCQLFEAFSSSIQWILETKLQVPSMSHILDDFIFFGPPNSTICKRSLESFLALATSLSIPIKAEKTVQPSTCVSLHGIEVDTRLMTLRLPQDKLVALQATVASMSRRKKTTLRDLQSLLGSLNFACRVIVPGRAFMRRLHDLTKGITRPTFYIRLNKEARADLAAWDTFLQSFNGRALCLPHTWDSSEDLHLYSDACGTSYAAVFGPHWFIGEFPPSWLDRHITIKEFVPILLAILLWGQTIANKKILFFCDNMAVVEIINSQTSKDAPLMSLVRPLVIATLTNNILFTAKHIPGKTNVVADLLSRSQVAKARSIAPWLDETPQTIPPHLFPWYVQPQNF
jgi:hypothetical protein